MYGKWQGPLNPDTSPTCGGRSVVAPLNTVTEVTETNVVRIDNPLG
jgi:hypothetical protein